ncbi:MAG TPA: FAD-dependent oxidoreductase [Panacibacter sp.]|nr:FAD-dependent oxidoreductase [Panacibacter sp.]HNP44188.1 FAD-dependent oxidoreductase [Panacibacter sp.]
MKTFDVIIVGKGLMGAAAARHLATQGANIVVIGPDEPTDLNKATVFSSHYDQGRLQRIVGRNEVWTRLNIESTQAYPFLESQTGIQFHYAVGCLYASVYKNDDYLQRLPIHAKKFGFPFRLYDGFDVLKNDFPEFIFPNEVKANFEAAPSGHINPRQLIKAQLALCRQRGAKVIADTVLKVQEQNGCIIAHTENGSMYRAKKVLLAPGAFANSLDLLQRKLAIRLKSETIVLAKVSEQEAQRLSSLPSLLYEIETKDFEEIYLIRPIQYPDGNWYLKMGCNLSTDIFFDSLAPVQQWFRHGNSDANLPVLKAALHSVLPGLQVQDYIAKRCIITYTGHKHQYIGPVEENVYIATGGNGYSAMCSDAVGKLSAHVVLNYAFPEPYMEQDFKPLWQA